LCSSIRKASTPYGRDFVECPMPGSFGSVPKQSKSASTILSDTGKTCGRPAFAASQANASGYKVSAAALEPAIVSEPTWLGGALLAETRETQVLIEAWARSHGQWLSNALRGRGAVLLRGFATLGVEGFDRAARAITGKVPQPYTNRSTPRKSVSGNIFTSTEYPASESIPLHNENSYSASWPDEIFFLCVQPAQQGGQTPIADSRLVYSSIPKSTRTLFESKGVMYVRNYGDLGLSWQETFQSNSKADVEKYCTAYGIVWEWGDGEQLRTRHVLPAVRRHPQTCETVWFNQAHLFHLSNLGDVGNELVELLGRERVPRHALFGDGSEIPPEFLIEVRGAYEKCELPLDWQRNDLLILDNMLWAHGRRPFAGPRTILVAMT
jgi:alpha-ketoglutarate-dependent taurine dioxygenase